MALAVEPHKCGYYEHSVATNTMSEPSHRILLRGPWQCEWLEGPEPALAEEPSAVRMPVSWQDAFGSVAGRVRFRRRFHSPTNLEPEEHVVLAFEALGGMAEISVNGTSIASVDQPEDILRCDVTELLRPFNDLTVDICFDARSTDRPGGLWKPVAIEIHFVMPG